MTANTFQRPSVRAGAEKDAWWLEILAKAERDQAIPRRFVLLRLFCADLTGGELQEREWS